MLDSYRLQFKLQLKINQYNIQDTKMQVQLKQLIAKKDEMQKKLAQIEEQLRTMDENYHLEKGTVDSEGFPRADLDFGHLANYKNLKRTKAQLNNDHLQIMKQIEKKLFQHHKNLPDVEGQQQIFPNKQQKKAAEISGSKKETHNQQQKPHNIDYLTPFAKISFVNPDSPACKAGVKEQDLVSQLSEVNIYTIDPMKQIPKHVKEGVPFKLVVLRPLQGEEKGQGIFQLKDNKYYKKITIQIVPAMWAGRGILGCKIDPLI